MKNFFRIFFGFLALYICHVSSAFAGVDLFTRYFRDENRESISVASTQVLGSIQDGKVHLTEHQAIEMALRHNLDINVQRHEPIFRLWEIERSKGAFDPAGVFGLNWNRERTPAVSALEGGPSVTSILTSHLYGYRQNFESGSSFEVNFTGLRNRSTNFFTSLVPAINTGFEVLFRQNVLKGFGRTAPDYQIEIARNNLDISEQEFRRQTSAIIFQVQDRYWELQHALEDIEVKEKALQLATTILEQNRAKFEVGTAARLEVVQGEAEVAVRREELIRAQFEYRRVQDQLIKLITNLDDPRQFPGEIIPTDPVYMPPTVDEPFDKLQGIAAELRPEMEQADLEIANEKVNLDLSRNQLRPTLDLVLGYQQFGLGGTRIVRDFSRGFFNAPIVDIVPGGLGSSLEQLFSADFYGYVLGFNLQLPIFNTEARARNAEAQIAMDRAQLRKRSAQQSISLEIRDALTQIEMNHARMDSAQAAVRLAGERLEGEKARFEVGMGTTRELIETQRDLQQAESVLLRAQIDLIKSHALLDKALGRTFEVHKIKLSDALKINVK